MFHNTRILAILLILISVVCFSGCSITSYGRMATITPKEVDTIELNVTTKEEILETFGDPQKMLTKPSGVGVFVYTRGVERHVGVPFIISLGRIGGTGQTLTITFQNDVVVDYEFSVDQRHIHK